MQISKLQEEEKMDHQTAAQPRDSQGIIWVLQHKLPPTKCTFGHGHRNLSSEDT